MSLIKRFSEFLSELLTKKKEANTTVTCTDACNQDAPSENCPMAIIPSINTCAVHENNVPCAVTSDTEIEFAPKVMVKSRYAAAAKNPSEEPKKRVRKSKTQKNTKNND